MASSNRNWPSMFKSKPCNNDHHLHHHHHNCQWQHHDIDNPSLFHSICHGSSPFASERVPDPKPRWNPKPEQIRILESIFNTGMVNPPRDEIRKIRIQLQEYGQVGEANVFYWFQNRKSRSKHKLRLNRQNPNRTGKPKMSNSDHNRNTQNEKNSFTPSTSGPNTTFGSVNQKPMLFPVQDDGFLITEPGLLFPVHNEASASQLPFGFSDHQLNDLILATPAITEELTELHPFGDHALNGFPDVNDGFNSKIQEREEEVTVAKIPVPETASSGVAAAGGGISSFPVIVPLVIGQTQGERCSGGGVTSGSGLSSARSTVFINDKPFEVAAGQFHVREAFGNDAVLINSSGQPILTDEWGVTLQSLQNGAVYYLI